MSKMKNYYTRDDGTLRTNDDYNRRLNEDPDYFKFLDELNKQHKDKENARTKDRK